MGARWRPERRAPGAKKPDGHRIAAGGDPRQEPRPVDSGTEARRQADANGRRKAGLALQDYGAYRKAEAQETRNVDGKTQLRERKWASGNAEEETDDREVPWTRFLDTAERPSGGVLVGFHCGDSHSMGELVRQRELRGIGVGIDNGRENTWASDASGSRSSRRTRAGAWRRSPKARGAALLRRQFSPLFIGVFARGHSLFGAVCGGTARWAACPRPPVYGPPARPDPGAGAPWCVLSGAPLDIRAAFWYGVVGKGDTC